jgi:organic radical activating enzyme
MSVMYPLAKDGVFWTIQGEGALSGDPMVRVSVEELVAEIQAAIPEHAQRPWVWLTGGGHHLQCRLRLRLKARQ